MEEAEPWQLFIFCRSSFMKTSPVKIWRRQKGIASAIGRYGRILQWTVIRIPPRLFAREAPFPVVIVQLEEGEKTIGQLVDWELKDLKKGKKVVVVLRRLAPETPESLIPYVLKFKPV